MFWGKKVGLAVMHKKNAYELRNTLDECNVEYMVIGKGAAILQGYSSTTQDIDIFPSKDKVNCMRLLMALKSLGFRFDVESDGCVHSPSQEVLDGKDFIHLKGPFELDIVFAPDGFECYEEALPMKKVVDGFPVLSIDGIIRTKVAANRKKDLNDIDDLRLFGNWLKEREKTDGQK